MKGEENALELISDLGYNKCNSPQWSVAPWRSGSEGSEAVVDYLRLQWARWRIVV